MLSSLLPGIREVRAPLAAGFVWLVALWFFFEPEWNRENNAEGVIGSINRLMGTFNLVGQGVVLSFAAYLIGSFSVLLSSRPLLSLFPTSIDTKGGPLTGLSALGRVSLAQVASDGRQRLEDALALSGVGVDEVLRLAPLVPDSSDKMAVVRRRRHRNVEDSYLRANTMLPSPEQWQEREIAKRVLRDLPVVGNAQLLGHQPDVFSAVDRSQAEVEFRVALVPAILALSVAVAVAVDSENVLVPAVTVLVGGLGAAGLILDAARQRRQSNELILSLMEHGRITPPSVSRAESAAAKLADQAPAKVVGRQAEEVARAIRQYIASLSAVPSSGTLPMLTQAHEASARAHTEAKKLDQLLDLYLPSPTGHRTAHSVLDSLDRALSGWIATNPALFHQGGLPAGVTAPAMDWPEGGPSPDELRRLVIEGRERNAEMIRQAREAVSEIAGKDTSHSIGSHGAKKIDN